MKKGRPIKLGIYYSPRHDIFADNEIPYLQKTARGDYINNPISGLSQTVLKKIGFVFIAPIWHLYFEPPQHYMCRCVMEPL